MAADQAAKALFEFDHRFRNLVLTKGITPCRPNRLETRFGERLIGHAEGQFGDDDRLQGVTWHVNTLPEAVRP